MNDDQLRYRFQEDPPVVYDPYYNNIPSVYKQQIESDAANSETLRFRFSRIASDHPVLFTIAIAGAISALIYFLTRHTTQSTQRRVDLLEQKQRAMEQWATTVSLRCNVGPITDPTMLPLPVVVPPRNTPKTSLNVRASDATNLLTGDLNALPLPLVSPSIDRNIPTLSSAVASTPAVMTSPFGTSPLDSVFGAPIFANADALSLASRGLPAALPDPWA